MKKFIISFVVYFCLAGALVFADCKPEDLSNFNGHFEVSDGQGNVRDLVSEVRSKDLGDVGYLHELWWSVDKGTPEASPLRAIEDPELGCIFFITHSLIVQSEVAITQMYIDTKLVATPAGLQSYLIQSDFKRYTDSNTFEVAKANLERKRADFDAVLINSDDQTIFVRKFSEVTVKYLRK